MNAQFSHMEYMSFSDGGKELDEFSETDEKGVSHNVVWKLAEVAKNMEYEIWWCDTHDQPFYGSCMKDGNT